MDFNNSVDGSKEFQCRKKSDPNSSTKELKSKMIVIGSITSVVIGIIQRRGSKKL